MLGTYACAVVICVVAIVLGRGLCGLCGYRTSPWLAPAVGLGFLLAACEILVRLPGHGYTAGAILLVLCAGAAVAGRDVPWPDPRDAVPVALVVLALATIPFVANARVGVLGISVLNDTHWHLFLAQGLLDPGIRHLDDYGPGYPLGPHAIAAVFGQSLGTSVDRSLTGLLIATPVLTGLTALGLLARLTRWQRWLTAILAGIPYMAAAWYVQSAFKEPILALMLLGMVVALGDGRAEGFARPAATAVPVALLIVGTVYDYSYPGLAWPLVVLVCWAALELGVGGAWRHLRPIVAGARAAAVPLGIGVLVLVVLIAPDIGRIHEFYAKSGGSAIGTTGSVTTDALANLPGPVHRAEGLGVWLWGDFRYIGPRVALTHIASWLALGALLYAAVRAVRRRELAWLGGAVGTALLYFYAQHSQSPYIAAKSLMVPGPILVAGTLRALFSDVGPIPWRGRSVRLAAGGVLAGVVAACLLAAGFVGDVFSLRDAMVGPSAHTRELRGLRRLLHGQPTLAAFNDDYVKWELLGVPVSSPLLSSPTPVGIWPEKPFTYGQPIDFNSFAPADLDRFRYVITTRTAAQSQPPSNFHLVGRSASYEVWRRRGPTRPYHVLAESGQAGAVLRCTTAAGRRIARSRGVAAVRTAPVSTAVPGLAPGQSAPVILRLARGTWSLSVPFTSTQALTVSGPGVRVDLPANLDRPGPLWPVAQVRSTGRPIVLEFTMHDAGPLSSGSPATQFFVPQAMVATRVGRDAVVPLRRACGRYVDWYRTVGHA